MLSKLMLRSQASSAEPWRIGSHFVPLECEQQKFSLLSVLEPDERAACLEQD